MTAAGVMLLTTNAHAAWGRSKESRDDEHLHAFQHSDVSIIHSFIAVDSPFFIPLDDCLPKIIQRRLPMVIPAVERASDRGTPHPVGGENVIIRFQKRQ